MALKRDFFQMLMNARSKWVNVFKTAYFFGQGPSCRPATHTQKINPQWQVPKCMRYRRERAAVSRSTICLMGVGFSLRQVVFVHLVYFYQDCTMILAHVLIIFLLLWGCRNRTMFFWMKCPSFTRFWWLYEWVHTWTCIFVAAPIMTKSVACSQDGATNWTEALSIITCLCTSMYILIISSTERRCSKQKPQYVSHTSEVHFCLLPLVV